MLLPEEWIPIEGSLEAISFLNNHGYIVVVATNQSAISKKLFTHATLNKIHQKMSDLLELKRGKIDKVFYSHTHADQTHGINDLRSFFISNKKPINVYADRVTSKYLKKIINE